VDRFNKLLEKLEDVHTQEIDVLIPQKDSGYNLMEIIPDFLKFVKGKLKYKKDPEIILDKSKDKVLKLKALGSYAPYDNVVWVYVNNRNTADILRTLAHELVHVKQHQSDRKVDGTTGSEDENEANSLAGILMREYGKMNPEIYN